MCTCIKSEAAPPHGQRVTLPRGRKPILKPTCSALCLPPASSSGMLAISSSPMFRSPRRNRTPGPQFGPKTSRGWISFGCVVKSPQTLSAGCGHYPDFGCCGCHVNEHMPGWLLCQPAVDMLSAAMSTKPLSARELRVWHAFQLMGEDVLGRVGRDISQATGLSGPEFGVLSRLAAIGNREMRQQAFAKVIGCDKSRLSHQLTRMNERAQIGRAHV